MVNVWSGENKRQKWFYQYHFDLNQNIIMLFLLTLNFHQSIVEMNSLVNNIFYIQILFEINLQTFL